MAKKKVVEPSEGVMMPEDLAKSRRLESLERSRNKLDRMSAAITAMRARNLKNLIVLLDECGVEHEVKTSNEHNVVVVKFGGSMATKPYKTQGVSTSEIEAYHEAALLLMIESGRFCDLLVAKASELFG
jgi:hypothetical protein